MLADDDSKRLRAELNGHPAFDELKRWAHEQRDLYLRNLAKALFLNPAAVTEAAVGEKSAFFRGMNFVLNQPFFSAKSLEGELERKEPDNEPR